MAPTLTRRKHDQFEEEVDWESGVDSIMVRAPKGLVSQFVCGGEIEYNYRVYLFENNLFHSWSDA
jgi:hypothetical protein